MTAWQKWVAWGNDAADNQVKSIVLVDWRTTYLQVNNAYKRMTMHRRDLQLLYQLVVAGNKRCLESSKETVKNTRKEFRVDFTHSAFACPKHSRSRAPMLDLPDDLYLAFPWGPVYLWRILTWARSLTWKPSGSSVAVGDIAFIELLVDYVLFTGSWPPRNISSQSQRNSNYGFGEYILDDVDSVADVQAIPLASHSNIWKRTMQWLMKYLPGRVLQGTVIRHTTSLAQLGCPAWHEGLDLRPHLSCHYAAATALAKYYVTKLGCKRNMDRVLQLDLARPAKHPSKFDVPFNARLAGIRRAKDIFQAFTAGR